MAATRVRAALQRLHAVAADVDGNAGAGAGGGGGGGPATPRADDEERAAGMPDSFVVEQMARLRSQAVRAGGAASVDVWEAAARAGGGKQLLQSVRGLRAPALPVPEILGLVGEGLAALQAHPHPAPANADAGAGSGADTEASGDAEAQLDTDDMAAVLLASAAVALYGTIFDALITAVLPTQAYMAYWTGLRRDSLAAAYEIAQGMPARLWQLGWGLLHPSSRPTTLSIRAILRWNPVMAARQRYAARLAELDSTRQRIAWCLGALASCVDTFDGCSGRAALLDRTSALLAALTTIADAAASVTSKDLDHIVPSPGSATSLGAMLPLPPPSPGPDVTTASIQAQLASFEGRVDALQTALATLEARNQPPPASQRLWIPATLAVVGGYYATQALSAHQVELTQWITDAAIASGRFAVEFIFRPLYSMYQTIRYDEHQLALIRGDALQADINSLNRMVEQYAVDRLLRSPADMAVVLQAVQSGDFGVIMRPYEDSIRTPIQGLLFGDLARLVLIQVQKTKVDVEVAMTALDKLLKANELNFTLLTLVPAVAAVVLLVRQLRSLLAQRDYLASGDIHRTVRMQLRLVERLLNRHNIDQGRYGRLPSLDQGLLLMDVHVLRECCRLLRMDDVDAFRDDLRELEQPALSVQQRLAVVDRVYRTFPRIVYGGSANINALPL